MRTVLAINQSEAKTSIYNATARASSSSRVWILKAVTSLIAAVTQYTSASGGSNQQQIEELPFDVKPPTE